MHSNTVSEETKHIRQTTKPGAQMNKCDKTEFSVCIPAKDV